MRTSLIAATAALLLAAPAGAQAPAGPPGRAEVSRVQAGVYKVDPHHTQVVWAVNHLGVSPLYGMFGEMSGSLTIDPANPSAAKVVVDIPMTGIIVGSKDFADHLRSKDFFDAGKFPSARFVSTAVKVNGMKAAITGDLTVHGVTKPVVLDATFYGAGPHPRDKSLLIGFTAKTQIKRSDFGLGYGVPMVPDDVDLKITATFQKE